ncbi:hypothetical protein NKH94_15590 [Mesorhizobium australicum]|uniref:primase alpha helix C-terminal domain-containing protein n=1 Tax=Mesorhizobium australicum TaxID=536018 RepID=UPI00333B5E85
MGQYSDDTILRFSNFFQGFHKAHGRYEIKGANEKGKNEGKAFTYTTPPTPQLWEAHVKGEGPGLGIIPLRSDNTVLWGCIDIDVIGIDLAVLEAKCKKLGLPLVICRSKSGGAHCFLFLRDPVDATVVVDALSAWAAVLGYGGCEIFPKQTTRYDLEKDVGNWLNMPYFFADKTTRYGIKNGDVLDLPHFIDHAEEMSVTEDELVTVDVTNDDNDMFADGPPCLRHLASNGGFPDGTRNDGMYNVAVYLKMRFPDDWQDKLQEYNVATCDPPLTLAEINTIQKSVSKKDYGYRCRKPPIAAHCNRRVCLTCEHGVGGGEGNIGPEITHLAKYEGNPVYWFATIADKRMMLRTEELTDQNKFRTKMLSTINRLIPKQVGPRWDRYIDELCKNCQVIEVAEEMQDVGRFHNLLDTYLLGQARTTTKEQLMESLSPYITGDGEVWFRVEGLLRHLDRQGFRHDPTTIYKWLRDCGAEDSQLHVKGVNKRIWKIREPSSSKEPDPENHFGSEEF